MTSFFEFFNFFLHNLKIKLFVFEICLTLASPVDKKIDLKYRTIYYGNLTDQAISKLRANFNSMKTRQKLLDDLDKNQRNILEIYLKHRTKNLHKMKKIPVFKK